jgi:protein-L-isoaspartate(D-aspartate) O-methyltransferase
MHDEERRVLIERLLLRGIHDASVLAAFATVPREAFVPEALVDRAYEDGPLPIGQGQTISQPYVVALTLQSLILRPTDHVLDVGTGSGYAAALLARVAREVTSVERIPELAEVARERLRLLGFTNVRVVVSDGTLGCARYSPFDGIAVAAAGPRIPQALKEQLVVGGRLVIPVGARGDQYLVRVTRVAADRWTTETLAGVSYVPLIGAQGFKDASGRTNGHGPWMH